MHKLHEESQKTTERHNVTKADCDSSVSLEIVSWISFYKPELPSGHSAMERESLQFIKKKVVYFKKRGSFEHFSIQVAEQTCQRENETQKVKGSGTQTRNNSEIAQLLYLSLMVTFYLGSHSELYMWIKTHNLLGKAGKGMS